MKKTLLKMMLAAAMLTVGMNLQAQKDVTKDYIKDATLSSLSGWTVKGMNGPQQGNNTKGYASEAYSGWENFNPATSPYYLKQTIKLPAGHYTLVNYSFYREGQSFDTDPTISRAKLYAGSNEVEIMKLGEIAAGGYANSQAEGANAFDSKMYRNTVDFTIPADNTEIEIGVTGTFETMRSWFICGMFELIDNDQPATMASPFDVTGYLTNPGFEYRNMEGWELSEDGALWAQGNNQSFKVGGHYAEAWQSADNGPLSARSMSQTLTGLPAGYYELTVNLGGSGTYVDVNGKRETWTADKDYTVTYVLDEGEDLVITAGKDDEGTANWIHFDNFRLKFGGDVAAAYKTTLAEAKALLDVKMSQAYKADLEAVIALYDEGRVNENSSEDLQAAIKGLNEGMAKAQISINSYKLLDEGGMLPDNSLAGWTCTNAQTFHINTWSVEGNSDGTGMKTPFIENWLNAADGYLGEGEIYYTLEGLDPGIYQFSALIRAYSEIGNDPAGASLFANNREIEFETGQLFTYTDDRGTKNGIFDNYAMAAEVGDDGVFRFGVKISADANFNWMAFKNCKVAYVGAAITLDAVNEMAATMPDAPMNADVKYNAEQAISEAQNHLGLETYEAMTKAIAAANASVEAYKNAKTALEAQNAFMNSTNVYTEEAYDLYYSIYEATLANYTDGVLTDIEANTVENPSALLGHHAANDIDDLLMSAWEGEPEDWDGYHVNTWSTEGVNDGSNFVVPFIEYWVNANALPTRTYSASLFVDPGTYDVTALIRVGQQNDEAGEPTGITLQVNDGDPVDVTTGAQIGTSRLYMGEFTAQGEVGADGLLIITFNVADDNNVNWLAFKNMVYVDANKVSTAIREINAAGNAKVIYNMAGQRVTAPVKGINIVNGKKFVVK